MENWGEDWIWHVRIYSTSVLDKLSEFISFFENFHIQWKMEKGLILDMSSLDVLHMQGTSCEIVLIFKCTQNMVIGMNRYTTVVS